MNADHSSSLALYLEHHHHVPSFIAAHARLTSLTPDALHLTSFFNLLHYTIPLTPPLQPTLSDARDRLVSMDRAAKTALHRDAVVLARYERPRGAEAAVFLLCAATFVLLHSRANLAPGSALAVRVPRVAAWLYTLRPWVFWPMLAAHALEAATMHRTRMRRFNVPSGGRVWWAWVASCFVEGVGAFWRVDRVVEAERRRLEAKKH